MGQEHLYQDLGLILYWRFEFGCGRSYECVRLIIPLGCMMFACVEERKELLSFVAVTEKRAWAVNSSDNYNVRKNVDYS